MAESYESEFELKEAERLFRKNCEFTAGADVSSRIPPPYMQEVAFAGRSNVGKSSLINALVFRKSLVRVSNTPGRTQQINFFNLGDVFDLVDLPGYGYAVASKSKTHEWNKMVIDYLKKRQTLKRVILLIDSRHGIKPNDKQTMEVFDEAGVPYTIVLTKADKINKTDQEKVLAEVEEEIKKHAAAMPRVFLTSSEKRFGLDVLRSFIRSVIA